MHKESHPRSHRYSSIRPTGRSRGPAVLAVGIVSLLWTVGAGAQSQYPLFTQDTFVATMKTVGRNFSAVTQAIGQDDFESAKSRPRAARHHGHVLAQEQEGRRGHAAAGRNEPV